MVLLCATYWGDGLKMRKNYEKENYREEFGEEKSTDNGDYLLN